MQQSRDGVTPWNINRSLMLQFIKEFHSKHLEDFNNLDNKFRKLNSLLIDIRRKQSADTAIRKNKIKELEKNAATEVKEIGVIGNRIEETILKLKY